MVLGPRPQQVADGPRPSQCSWWPGTGLARRAHFCSIRPACEMCANVPDGGRSRQHIKHAEKEVLSFLLDLVMAILFCITSHQSMGPGWSGTLVPIAAHEETA